MEFCSSDGFPLREKSTIDPWIFKKLSIIFCLVDLKNEKFEPIKNMLEKCTNHLKKLTMSDKEIVCFQNRKTNKSQENKKNM